MISVLFGVLVVLFACNAPIAVAIGLAGAAALFAQGDFQPMIVLQRMYGGADSFPLMAVPLFMIAGKIMEKGGLTARLVAFAESVVGWLPGGLAAVCVVSAMLFAGISGSAAADTAAVGGILIPAMIRGGYRREYAGAVQAAAGSIGVVIPPSIPLIIFGALTGASTGKLFAAGLLPGLLIGATLVGVAVVASMRAGWTRSAPFSMALVRESAWRAGWALGAPVLILGGILGGVFTATESAAIAVVYAAVVGLFCHRELRFRDLPSLVADASVTAAVIMFIIASATVFSWILAVQQMPIHVAAWLTGLTDNPVVLLLLVNALFLLAGTFVETTAALILFVPVVAPLMPALGVDMVQLGVIVVVNLAIGMLTPPLGICLVVACGIANITLARITRAVLPFLLVLLLDLLVVSFFHPLTTWLPSLF